MLHIKNNIAAGITMAVLFMAPVACATTHPAKDTKATTPAAAAPAAAPVAEMGDASPEAIKMRSGPGDPVAGKDKSLLCQGCHGEVGVSIEGMAPKLAGQYAGYIEKQVHNFQSGARVHEINSHLAESDIVEDKQNLFPDEFEPDSTPPEM